VAQAQARRQSSASQTLCLSLAGASARGVQALWEALLWRCTARLRHKPSQARATYRHARALGVLWAGCARAAGQATCGRTRGTVCRMGEMSVYRYSSLRVVGIRSVRSAAAHSARTGASLQASLRSVAEGALRRGRRTGRAAVLHGGCVTLQCALLSVLHW